MSEQRFGFVFDALSVSELDECVEPRDCRGDRPPVVIARDRCCSGFDVSLEALEVALQEREPEARTAELEVVALHRERLRRVLETF